MNKKFTILLLIFCLMLSGCSMSNTKGNNNQKSDNTSDKIMEQTGGTMVEGTSSINGIDTQKTTGIKSNASMSTNEYKIFTTIYYKDKDGMLIPITRKLVKQDGIARASINGLIDNSANREELAYYGLYPVLPQGTEILGIDIRQGVAVVDFNEKFLDYNNETEEKIAIASLVYTLTEFKTINSVSINVNGQPQDELKHKTNVAGTLSREDVLINNDKLFVDRGTDKLEVYMYKNIEYGISLLVPVSIEYEKVSDEYLPDKIAELLNTDLSDKNLVSYIPSGIKLNESSFKSGVLTLDFTNQSKDGIQDDYADKMLNQILYSMSRINGVEKIKILIKGKEMTLKGETELSKQLPLQRRINEIID